MNRNRVMLLAVTSLALVGAFYLLREHWAHVLGATPYLLLLACPLLHLFHGHGNHAGRADTDRGKGHGHDPA
jgi:hypothetical protein